MHVLVHGGAGDPPAEPSARQRVLRDATDAATDADSPIESVRTAVGRLEADHRFNAGLGSAVQSDGQIRTEAGLMTGDGTAGAACGMSGVENAVEVAHVVATETPHLVVAGDPAVALAAERDIETDADLWTERTRERWDEADPPDGGPAEQLRWVRERFDAAGGESDGADGVGTVGAVATDGERLATATSTGGRWFALAGRVGDVPQIGAGFYADERGCASATGAGEAIARFDLARRAVEALDQWGPHQAADQAIEDFDEATGADAGVVVMDPHGHAAGATNAPTMQTAGTARKQE